MLKMFAQTATRKLIESGDIKTDALFPLLLSPFTYPQKVPVWGRPMRNIHGDLRNEIKEVLVLEESLAVMFDELRRGRVSG